MRLYFKFHNVLWKHTDCIIPQILSIYNYYIFFKNSNSNRLMKLTMSHAQEYKLCTSTSYRIHYFNRSTAYVQSSTFCFISSRTNNILLMSHLHPYLSFIPHARINFLRFPRKNCTFCNKPLSILSAISRRYENTSFRR